MTPLQPQPWTILHLCNIPCHSMTLVAGHQVLIRWETGRICWWQSVRKNQILFSKKNFLTKNLKTFWPKILQTNSEKTNLKESTFFISRWILWISVIFVFDFWVCKFWEFSMTSLEFSACCISQIWSNVFVKSNSVFCMYLAAWVPEGCERRS